MVRLTKQVLDAAVSAARGGNTKLARQIVKGEVPWNRPALSRLEEQRAREAAARAASDAVESRNLDLESRLLRRWQRGKPVPEWFKPWESGNSLLRHQAARAGGGQMSIPKQFPKASFDAEKFAPPLAAAQARNAGVKKAVSASSLPVERIAEAQRICRVYNNPKICRKVAEMLEEQIPELKMTMGSWNGRQHAWNTLPDGTVVDATASQFKLPFLNVVPKSVAKRQGYRAADNKKLNKFLDDYRNLTEGGIPDDMDLMLGRQMGYDAMAVLRAQGIF